MASVKISWPDEAPEGEDTTAYNTENFSTAQNVAGHSLGASVSFSEAGPQTPTNVKPFASDSDMEKAASERLPDGRLRMHADADYRAEVEARIAASYGFSGTFTSSPTFMGEEAPTPQPRQPRVDPSLLIGGGEQAQGTGFRSTDEMVRAMSDPRYATCEIYRAEVDAKTMAM